MQQDYCPEWNGRPAGDNPARFANAPLPRDEHDQPANPALAATGVAAVVTGKALLEGRISLEEIGRFSRAG